MKSLTYYTRVAEDIVSRTCTAFLTDWSVADNERHSYNLLNHFSRCTFGTDIICSDVKFVTCINRCLLGIPIQ